MKSELSKRIWATRYFMVIGIIVLHLPEYQPLREVETAFEYVKAFFSHGIFRATVPVLTVISGYLVFRSRLYLTPLNLVQKKAKSVLIPLLLWNLPLVFIIYLSQKHNLLSHNFSAQLYPIEPINWIDALTGLFSSPVNYPLNFLRDLFAVSLLAPLFGFVLNRAPYLGLALISGIYFFNLDGDIVLRNSMLVSFYIGGLAAIKNWDLTALDKYAVWLATAFVALCLLVVTYKIENRELLRLVSPFMVWPALSLIQHSKVYEYLYKYSHCSFFTFLAHGPLILLFWFVYTHFFSTIAYPIYWLLTPITTVAVCILMATYFKKHFPKSASLLLGGR